MADKDDQHCTVRAAVSEGVAQALEGFQHQTDRVPIQPNALSVTVIILPPGTSAIVQPGGTITVIPIEARDFRVTALCTFVVLLPIGILSFLGAGVENHVGVIIGLVLIAAAVILTFTFRDVTPLQRQILLALFALSGGAIATEIPGFLNLNVTLGEKTAVGAGGAMAVFVLLYLFSAPKPPA